METTCNEHYQVMDTTKSIMVPELAKNKRNNTSATTLKAKNQLKFERTLIPTNTHYHQSYLTQLLSF